MKKLMIAAAIVCAAAMSQAANFSWGFSSTSIKGPAGTEWVDASGYLTAGYAMLYIAGEEIAGPATMKSFKFGVFNDTASDSKGVVQALPSGDISASFVGQAYTLILRTPDDKYEIVYDGISTYKAVAQSGQPSLNYEQFIDKTAYKADDWQTVPEPTSGLLLLLGVAGLALRRRRA